MRFSETLLFNAKPEWWKYYIPYDNLKQHISALQYLHNQQLVQSHSPRKHQYHHQHAESSDEDSDNEASSRASTITPYTRRTVSQRILAEIEKAPQLPTSRQVNEPHYGAVEKGQYISSLDCLLSSDASPAQIKQNFEQQEQLFSDSLNLNVRNIDAFYLRLTDALQNMTQEIATHSVRLLPPFDKSLFNSPQVEHIPLLNDDDSANISHQPPPPRQQSPSATEFKRFRQHVIEHYKELGATLNFASLNRTGFDRILQKHDKYTGRSWRASFMHKLDVEAEFTKVTQVEVMQHTVKRIYADIYKQANLRDAEEELRKDLPQIIIWDQSPDPQESLRTERRVSTFHVVPGGEKVDVSKAAVAVRWRPQPLALLFAMLASLVILAFPQTTHMLPVENHSYSHSTLDAAHRCLVLTIFVVVLWATEGIPLYVTSFLILPGAILFRVFVNSDGEPLSTQETSSKVFAHLSSDTLILIICVYSFSAALSKFEIDKVVATTILSRIRKPTTLLLAVMALSVFVSMFVSNVAAPVLLNSVMMPTIDAMRSSRLNRPYARCLLLGIMVSSNIGGFASPISSPQSAVALGLLAGQNSISFLTWLLAALPVCAVMIVFFYVALHLIYKPWKYSLPPLQTCTEKFGKPHWIISGTLLITVILWTFHSLSAVFGSAGIVAIIPILVLFGSGILTKGDFNNLPWDVVYLVAGGGVLGAAVESCQLLDLAAERLLYTIGETHLRLTYVIFCLFMAFVANFVSHTVSAIVVLPLIFKVGLRLNHPRLLVLAGTFAASSAMALPISSFPNISAIQVEDEDGVPYLTQMQILKVGTLMTVLATMALLFVGYDLMYWLKL